MKDGEMSAIDRGEEHCVLVEAVDPRLREATEARQASLEKLQALGWVYAETRNDGIVVSQRFSSEQAYLGAFETAAAAVGAGATLQEVPCESRYQ